MKGLAQIKQNAIQDGFKSPAVHAALAVLTTRQKRFVLGIMVQGLTPSAAATQAGYSSASQATTLLKNELVVDAISAMQLEYAKDLELSMQDVQQGMLDAIEIARITDNPMAMIAGWREIGKLIGVYVEKKEIKFTAEMPEALQDASTEELLKLVSSDVIEGELANVE